MGTFENYHLPEKRVRAIQQIIGSERIRNYIKKHGHEPEGDLSEFYRLTDKDLEPYRIYWYCKGAWNNSGSGSGYYLIDKSITNAILDTNSVTIKNGEGFYASINPISGYELLPENVLIKMGGENVTDWALSGTSYVEIPVVTGDISISAVATRITSFNVTTYGENFAFTGPVGFVRIDGVYSGTIIPDKGFTISSVVVMMGESDITRLVYDDKSGEITILSVSGDIQIYVETEGRKSVYVNFNGPKGSLISGTALIGTGEAKLVEYGCDIWFTIVPQPLETSRVTVEMGGIDISDTTYTYSSSSGSRHISIKSVSDDVVITYER